MQNTFSFARGLDNLLAQSRPIAVYGGLGSIGTALHFAILFAALRVVGPVAASTLGAIAGCIVNYFLSRYVVFSMRRARSGTFQRFVAVALFGIAVNAVVVRCLVDILPIALNQAIASASVVLIGYHLNKLWTFNARQD